MNNTESEFLKPSSYRDIVSTVTSDGKRHWIFALKPRGKLYNWRSALAWVYLFLFFTIPFVKINGLPLLLLNIVESKFVLFGKPFWPQDFYILAFGMIVMLIFIVLFTIIYGRLFCGWVCPQTIFMEFVFRKIEWLIDGNPMQQKKLAQMPWNGEKIRKRALKIIVFYAISLLIAHTFLSYILGIEKVLKIIQEPLSEHIMLFLGLLFFSFLFFSVYYFVREIVCTTICPYGRLQGVMFDQNTMQVAYDYIRGEPRQRFSKNRERPGGDCVDCQKCVDVCPTGIDIRNGLQMECVGCTACIDACNEMMDKFGFEPNLIRFASKENIEEKKGFRFSGRVKAYSVLLMFLLAALGIMIYRQSPVDLYLARVSGQLYREVGQDSLANYYTLKIINKQNREMPFEFQLNNFSGRIEIVGNLPKKLQKESVNQFYIWVYTAKKELKKRNTKFSLTLADKDGKIIDEATTNFYGPF